MDFFSNPDKILTMASTALLFFLTTSRVLEVSSTDDGEDNNVEEFKVVGQEAFEQVLYMDELAHAALHHFHLFNMLYLLDEEVRYWVKPRSTTWFLQFLVEQYNDERWLKLFRTTKSYVISLAEILKPTVAKKDTKYRLAIPIVVRVACTLFKLTQGASLLICSELFTIGRNTVSTVLREVVQAINLSLRSEIPWPTGQKLLETEVSFRHLCGLLGILGAIDDIHISISKPRNDATDYFYFKSGGFCLNCQAGVDSNKKFLDLFLGMLGSTNDSRVLQRSSMYHKAMQGTLWDSRVSFEGFTPYLVGDSGYLLLSWIMVPNPGQANLPLAQALFNKKLRRARGVVENAFRILKHSFCEFLAKSDLDVVFLPDVITTCALLHNLLLGQSHEEVEQLLHILWTEGLPANSAQEGTATAEQEDFVNHDIAQDKCHDLAIFLTLQRNLGA